MHIGLALLTVITAAPHKVNVHRDPDWVGAGYLDVVVPPSKPLDLKGGTLTIQHTRGFDYALFVPSKSLGPYLRIVDTRGTKIGNTFKVFFEGKRGHLWEARQTLRREVGHQAVHGLLLHLAAWPPVRFGPTPSRGPVGATR